MTYTLTHSDITAKLTLALSHTINNSQLHGWYNKLYRDEVVAEWKKVKGKMSLQVHCHISGGHFVHGDGNLFVQQLARIIGGFVWVYFHSNIPEFNKAELEDSQYQGQTVGNCVDRGKTIDL
ncbi:magnesium dechelatase SGR1, chloroplastic-like [Tripterygium wilfordii]|uniref:magnesium dechelatase SGR1, chloroplastic-like n=1 Tax=Tripterygium wilfordii TaxID=458696 RepID=UPI0018F81B5A|nr:magnesium dechelatase SGR1, chloroplastic-like [Tripterygium wilfordii]